MDSMLIISLAILIVVLIILYYVYKPKTEGMVPMATKIVTSNDLSRIAMGGNI
ncbi:hypothetical protein F-E9_432 [Faustovirus]|nr:hypothetical protein F-VV57_0410 [Faustovirus]QJX73678.1 hypothetical protein F-VV63_0412 [Faustovirus]QJX74185.1 hypothetical protein F-E9_432 [Faustovirus]